MFFWQRSSFALSTTIHSRTEPMAKPLTSWLVPSFSQHNLRLVVWEFRDDKFTSLQQVNSPNSWEKFQICCTDMYVIRFLPNFVVFCLFLWISRLCDSAKYQKPWLWAASFTLYKLATIFLQLVAKRRPEEPCFNTDTEGTEPVVRFTEVSVL